MAYQAKRQVKEFEDLELVDANGVVKDVIRVKLNDSDMIANVNKKYIDLVKAQDYCNRIKSDGQPSSEDMAEATENLGQCVISLYEAAFGAENAKKILDFYEGRIVEMIQEVNPFLKDVVIPNARKIAQNSRKGIMGAYNRKQRRSLLRK